MGYQAQLQTMYLDVQGAETVQGKRKKLAAVSLRVANTRGLSVGPTFNDNALVPVKEWNQNVLLGQPVPLVTADERIVMTPAYTVEGQICIQQDDPLPATVLGVIPEIVIGDTGGKG